MVLGSRSLSHRQQVHHVLLGQRAPLRCHRNITQRTIQTSRLLPNGKTHWQREVYRLTCLHRRRQHSLHLLRPLHRRQLHLAGQTQRRLHHTSRRHTAQMLRRITKLGVENGTHQRRSEHHKTRTTLLPHILRQSLRKPRLCRWLCLYHQHRHRNLDKIHQQPHPSTLGRPRRHRTPFALLRQGRSPTHSLPHTQQHRKHSLKTHVYRNHAIPEQQPRDAERPRHTPYALHNCSVQPGTHYERLGF